MLDRIGQKESAVLCMCRFISPQPPKAPCSLFRAAFLALHKGCGEPYCAQPFLARLDYSTNTNSFRQGATTLHLSASPTSGFLKHTRYTRDSGGFYDLEMLPLVVSLNSGYAPWSSRCNLDRFCSPNTVIQAQRKAKVCELSVLPAQVAGPDPNAYACHLLLE